MYSFFGKLISAFAVHGGGAKWTIIRIYSATIIRAI